MARVTLPDAGPLPKPSSHPRIAIVDPSTAVRTALPLMLPSLTFAAPYASCAAALDHRPDVDVVMLDPTAGADEPPGGSAVDTVAAFGPSPAIRAF